MQRRSKGEKKGGKILINASNLNAVLLNVTVVSTEEEEEEDEDEKENKEEEEEEEEEWRRHREINPRSSWKFSTQHSGASPKEME